MRQARGEVAVVGEQEQAFGVEVEAPDGIHVLAHAFEQREHGRPPLRIGSRGDEALRLVEQDIARLLRLDPPPIHAHIILLGIGLHARIEHGLPVHAHAPLAHKLLGRPARRYARSR